MSETSNVRSGIPGGESKRYEGMLWILKKIHPRQVIWFLLTALVIVLGWQGAGYISRLEAVEDHIEEQNGTLNEIQIEQQTQKVNIEWMIRSMGGEPATKPK